MMREFAYIETCIFYIKYYICSKIYVTLKISPKLEFFIAILLKFFDSYSKFCLHILGHYEQFTACDFIINSSS